MAGMFALAVLAFAGLYWLSTRLLVPMRRLREALMPTVVGAATFSVLLLLFGAVASSYRVEATGSRASYLAAAQAGLWATYMIAAVASGVLGAAFAGPGSRARLAGATFLGVLVFMVAALPFSELLAECYANVTLVLRPSC